MKSMILAFATGVVFVSPLAAQNAPVRSHTGETRELEVPYDDLNLASEKGQRILEWRLDRAARQVCGYDAQVTGSRIRSADATRCYREAKARSTTQFAAIVDQYRLGG